MSFRFLCALLITGSVSAQEGKNQYVILDLQNCIQKVRKANLPESFCKTTPLPFDQRHIEMLPAENGNTYYLMSSKGEETDGLELLCYRCTIKKDWKGDCGRYTSVRGNESWAKKCPTAPKQSP